MTAPEETLAWEAEQRPRAGLMAILAGVLILLSNFLLFSALNAQPNAPFADTLGSATDGRAGEQVVERAEFLADQLGAVAVPTVLQALGYIAAGLALLYLLRATMARGGQIRPWLRYVLLVGAAASAVGFVMARVGFVLSARSFVDGDDRSAEAARDALTSPAVANAGALLQTLGLLLFASAMLILVLNAMRVGLLTRFMGVLGMIAAGLFILPLDNLALIRSFWFVGLGLVILQRGPGAVPAAWETGQAEPWPTQQQLREARDAARAERAEPGPEPAAVSASGGGTPGEARRKRKKRR
jgi:hypothetical protein